MNLISSVSQLDEEILYSLYDNRLLKQVAVSLSRLTVHFKLALDVEVLSFSLDIVTPFGNEITLESLRPTIFIDEVRTLKKLTDDMDELIYVDSSIYELETQMTSLIYTISNLISSYYRYQSRDSFFIPSSVCIHFENKKEEFLYQYENPSLEWSFAWSRYIHSKRRLLFSHEFPNEFIDSLMQMKITSLERDTIHHRRAGDIDVLKISVLFNNNKATLSKFIGSNFETNFYHEGTLLINEGFLGTFHADAHGIPLGDFFSLGEILSKEFEDLFTEFFYLEKKRLENSFDEFSTYNVRMHVVLAHSRIGKSIVRTYIQDGVAVYVLNDGTKLMEFEK